MSKWKVREMLEHASRENLCDKGMPWPENHAQIADWILAMNLNVTVKPSSGAEAVAAFAAGGR